MLIFENFRAMLIFERPLIIARVRYFDLPLVSSFLREFKYHWFFFTSEYTFEYRDSVYHPSYFAFWRSHGEEVSDVSFAVCPFIQKVFLLCLILLVKKNMTYKNFFGSFDQQKHYNKSLLLITDATLYTISSNLISNVHKRALKSMNCH